jgi:hypothetical protein
MKTVTQLITSAILAAGLAITSTTMAASIAVSGSTLDIDTGKKFDQAIMTISGPNGFNTNYTLNNNQTQIDIDALNISAAGNYSYQIQYIQLGKIEYVSDPTTGRQTAPRNTGLVETKSGYFNVMDNQFIVEDQTETDVELNQQPLDTNPTSPPMNRTQNTQGLNNEY